MSNAVYSFVKDIILFGPVRRNKIATLLAYLYLLVMHVFLSESDDSVYVLIAQTILYFLEVYFAVFLCQGIGQAVLYMLHANRIAAFFRAVVSDKKVMSRLIRNTTVVTAIYAVWIVIFYPETYGKGGKISIYDPILTFMFGWGCFFAILYIIQMVIYFVQKLLNKFKKSNKYNG